MLWKKLPYWIKGGILLYFFTFIIMIIVSIISIFMGWGVWAIIGLVQIFISPLVYIADHVGDINQYISFQVFTIILIILSILELIIYFFIGSLLGIIYAKIKSKK